MPLSIPLEPSKANYTLSVTLGNFNLDFHVRWNTSDDAWYFDIYDDDADVVAINVKFVLGVNLGRTSKHKFFDEWILRGFDTAEPRSGDGADATFNDAGRRVLLIASERANFFGP